MKVGILTYHFVSNFGANLQTISTYKYVEKMGHIPIIINWIPEDLFRYYEKNVPFAQNEAHYQFAQNNYKNITKLCRSSRDIAEVIDEQQIELVIIGSDAVFTYVPKLSRFHLTRKGVIYSKPCIDSDFPNPFWGDFMNYVKSSVKVAVMSASAQNTEYKKIISRKQKSAFCDAITKFSYLSVRDIWTQDMILYLTRGKVCPIITPDPVFAFQQNVSPMKESFVIKKMNINTPYLLVSLTGKYDNRDWLKQLELEVQKLGLTLIGLPQTNKKFNKCLEHNIEFPIDPIQWYNLIRESNGYIGELMHPVLVSLHNANPVYVFDQYGFRSLNGLDQKSSKTYQIMKRFDLLSNYHNALMNPIFPNPKDVLSRIISFDKDKCRNKSDEMYKEYSAMMDNILGL